MTKRKDRTLGAIGNFRMLLNGKFWIKFAVIAWWSLVVGSYVWFLGLVGKAPILDGLLSVIAATLIGGAGMNHISNLYDKSSTDFTLAHLLPAAFVSLGAILLVVGTLLASLNDELWVQISGIVYVFFSVLAIVLGSDTAPRDADNDS